MGEAEDLSAYITLIYWKWAFALFSGITKISLLQILTFFADWPWISVVVNFFLDFFKNLIVFIALN